MGQQQLILMVLMTVVVGIAIVAGIDRFGEGAKHEYREEIRKTAVNVVLRAQAWHRSPGTLGGGEGSFAGFSLKKINHDSSSALGKMVLAKVEKERLLMIATSEEEANWRLEIEVYADSMFVRETN